MNIPYVMKKCGKCGRWLVASTVNFHRNKGCKYGLKSVCKECANKYSKQYHKANKEKTAEYNKQYHKANKEKEAERRKQYYKANKEKEAENCKRYYLANKDKIAEKHKQWRENNNEKIAKYGKQYRQDNKEKITKYNKQYNKQYYKDNKEKIAEWGKQYRRSPQGQAVQFNARNKRRHKKAAQGTGVTPDQWLEMMQYFDWRCAYSGERLTDKTRSGDHIVPIDAGGDDMVWNVVPMLRNLNSSKCAKDMLEWYREQDFFSEARLAKIYEWQEYARKKWEK